MISDTEPRFWERYYELPAEVRAHARRSYRLFRDNPDHPSLKFKPLQRYPMVYSVRIGRGHRAVGLRDRDTITWFWIGTHAEFDRDFA